MILIDCINVVAFLAATAFRKIFIVAIRYEMAVERAFNIDSASSFDQSPRFFALAKNISFMQKTQCTQSLSSRFYPVLVELLSNIVIPRRK